MSVKKLQKAKKQLTKALNNIKKVGLSAEQSSKLKESSDPISDLIDNLIDRFLEPPGSDPNTDIKPEPYKVPTTPIDVCYYQLFYLLFE